MYYKTLIIGITPYKVLIADWYAYKEHWHNEIEIMYCISGGFNVKINGNTSAVSAGQAVFIGSAESHEYFDVLPKTRILLLKIGPVLLGEGFSKLAELTFSKAVINIDDPQNSKPESDIRRLFQIIIDEYSSAGQSDGLLSEGNDWMIKSCLYALSAWILKYFSVIGDKAAAAQKKKRITAMMSVYKALEYIRTEYNTAIKLDDVMKITGLGKSNFCKQFKNATSLSFHEYLNMFRIDVACDLLKEHEITIASISSMTGFIDSKIFCRVFKQYINMTPKQYRNSLL